MYCPGFVCVGILSVFIKTLKWDYSKCVKSVPFIEFDGLNILFLYLFLWENKHCGVSVTLTLHWGRAGIQEVWGGVWTVPASTLAAHLRSFRVGFLSICRSSSLCQIVLMVSVVIRPSSVSLWVFRKLSVFNYASPCVISLTLLLLWSWIFLLIQSLSGLTTCIDTMC